MQVVLDPLLDAETVAALRAQLLSPEAEWIDGAATAGWHARGRKRNRQLQTTSGLHRVLADQLQTALQAHPLLQAAAFPRCIHGILFSRCGIDEGYGRHVDNAWMAGGRSDVSFTLALSDPHAYEGGALVIESPSGEESFRLQAGQALLYPSTLLHRVDPVTAGERLVAVGWIQSRIRQVEQRELLFELDTARRTLFERGGNDDVFDLVSRSYSNLLRRWDN
ncbi:MAG: Fe2+-dependent dioxygenase [Cyanobacteriota bacterium]|nr:Fe2+-dependent dioxygenase [Cyanobacteriota bacterium]